MKEISDNVDSLTLTYFMNPGHYNKYKTSESVQNSEKEKQRQRVFYRRRIMQATKDMSRGKSISDNIQEAYNAYADKLIEHFRTMDRHDIMQANYEGMQLNETKTASPALLKTSEQLQQDDIDILASSSKKPTGGSETMERFVVRKKVGVKQNVDFPSIKNISLDEPSLRDKGVDKRKVKKKKKI